MNFEQIRSRAEIECGYLKDDSCVKVYVGAGADSPVFAAALDRLQLAIKAAGVKGKVIASGSWGLDDLEPLALVKKPGRPDILFHNVTAEKAAGLVNDYLVGDKMPPGLALCSFGEKIPGISNAADLPLFSLQRRITLKNCGRIDPDNIHEYVITGGGYAGLAKTLRMRAAEVIEQVRKSGLRGRGGAGFPTAEKWQTCRDAVSDEKYLICDAVDADPHARTARLLLEGDPHSVLEGILIGAYAVGATHGFICVNAGYYSAVNRLKRALGQMRQYNLLGDHILDSAFSFDLEIKEVPSSLIFGEETALIRLLEGQPPLPYLRTVYPAVSGFQDKPTLVNNIETLAIVSRIFQNSSEQSFNTKIVTLAGVVLHQYTIEVPFGATLRTIVNDIGGGVKAGKTVKAIQFGGPAGLLFTPEALDITIDFETLKKAGGMVGSGTIEVFSGDACAVEITRDIMLYLQEQSCGKCVFCREGSYQILDILNDISQNRGNPADIDQLDRLAEAMRTGSICGFGRAASAPVLSALRLMAGDFNAHIKEKQCPAAEK